MLGRIEICPPDEKIMKNSLFLVSRKVTGLEEATNYFFNCGRNDKDQV